MATDTTNTAPAAATQAPTEAPKAEAPAKRPARRPAARKASAARKTDGATPGTKAKAARTTGRKPRSRRTPGATAARPSLGRPVTRPVAVAPEPEAVTVEVAAGAAPLAGSLLDAVEVAGTRVADYHEQIAEATPLPWVANVARANAEFTRIVTRAYVSGGRTLLRP